MINTQVRLAILGFGTECSHKNRTLAATVGKMAGRNGISLLAGNVTSTFGYAFQAAKEFKVANICVIEKHRKYPRENDATEIYHTEDTFSKHQQIAQMADAAILIGGGPGSQLLLNHFIRNHKTVIAIKGSGGIADGKLSKQVLIAKNPTEAFHTLFQIKKTSFFVSPLGPVKLTFDHFALIGLEFVKHTEQVTPAAKNEPFVKELTEYFNGNEVRFTGRIRLEGTDFQKDVWMAIMDIPYGKTMEFGELARHLKKEHADGPLAKVAFQNPIQIIIPSHRLSSKDGKLGKYPGGRELKIKLLDLEKQQTELSFF